MFSIRKDFKTGPIKYRVKVRAFKHSDDMHKFLSKQTDNRWRIMQSPVKSGTYIERGLPSELINIKSIDPSALAHM